MRRALIWAPILVVGVLTLALVRPVRLHQGDWGAGDRGGDRTVNRTVWLWAWQHASVTFTNSVTGGPVTISYALVNGFDRFHMQTDEKTEDYYTGGTYRINSRLRPQRTRSQRYCTVVGMTVTLGGRRYELADTCLEIDLLWPPF
ncbi:MAG TPA: hypothetical protein VKB31_04200 [Trueperaceae bacterium]|nr:hypothetical protein [Trueperaceae bacterium]